MAILTRLKRLFQADVHAILDAVEEPEAVLKQALREMQDALDLKRAQLVRNQATLASLKQAQATLVAQLQKVEADLQFALQEASDDLGRRLVARKLAHQKRLKTLQERTVSLAELCQTQAQEISVQQEELDAIREKARLFAPLTEHDSPRAVAESILAAQHCVGQAAGMGEVSDEEVELEWLRLQATGKAGGES